MFAARSASHARRGGGHPAVIGRRLDGRTGACLCPTLSRSLPSSGRQSDVHSRSECVIRFRPVIPALPLSCLDSLAITISLPHFRPGRGSERWMERLERLASTNSSPICGSSRDTLTASPPKALHMHAIFSPVPECRYAPISTATFHPSEPLHRCSKACEESVCSTYTGSTISTKLSAPLARGLSTLSAVSAPAPPAATPNQPLHPFPFRCPTTPTKSVSKRSKSQVNSHN